MHHKACLLPSSNVFWQMRLRLVWGLACNDLRVPPAMAGQGFGQASGHRHEGGVHPQEVHGTSPLRHGLRHISHAQREHPRIQVQAMKAGGQGVRPMAGPGLTQTTRQRGQQRVVVGGIDRHQGMTQPLWGLQATQKSQQLSGVWATQCRNGEAWLWLCEG